MSIIDRFDFSSSPPDFEKKSPLKKKKPKVEIEVINQETRSLNVIDLKFRIKPLYKINSETFFKEHQISKFDSNVAALRAIMQSPFRIFDRKIANAIDGFRAYLKTDNNLKTISFFSALLRAIDQEFDQDKSMKRLVFAFQLCAKSLNDVFFQIDQILEDENLDDITPIRTKLKSTLTKLEKTSKFTKIQVEKIIRPITIKTLMKAFDESFPLFIHTLKKFHSKSLSSVLEAYSNFESLLLKYGVEKTLYIYQYLIKTAETTHQIQPIILGMLKLANAEKYFHDLSFLMSPLFNTDIDLSLNFRFTNEAILLIIDSLKDKHQECKDLAVEICVKYEDLYNEVKKMIHNDIKRHFFFVRVHEELSHVSSVYLEKNKNGSYTLIIIDSANKKNLAPEFIRKAIPETITLKVFESRLQTQFTNVNCSIFSLRHFVAFAKHSSTLLKDISRHCVKTNELKRDNTHNFEITRLHPRLMQLSQSLSQITEYEDNNKILVELSIKHIREEWIKKNGLPIKKMVNAKIGDFTWKYHLLILERCLLIKSSSDTKKGFSKS